MVHLFLVLAIMRCRIPFLFVHTEREIEPSLLDSPQQPVYTVHPAFLVLTAHLSQAETYQIVVDTICHCGKTDNNHRNISRDSSDKNMLSTPYIRYCSLAVLYDSENTGSIHWT